MKKALMLISLLIVSMFATSAFAEGKPAIIATVTPESGTVGDVFTYSAKLTWPEGLNVIPPDPAEQMGQCRVLDRVADDLVYNQGINELNITLQIACYKTGMQKLPSLQITFSDSDGEQRKAQGPELSINIFRTLPEDALGSENPAESTKDIKTQAQLPPDYMTWAKILGFTLAAAILIYLIFSRIRKTKIRKEQDRIQVPEPYPYAMDRFAQGKLEGFLETENIDGFYIELTDILREYIEGRYEIDALEMTSREIALEMKALDLDGFLKSDFHKLLARADMAKFASIYPEVSQAQTDLGFGKEFVEKTQPEVQSEPEGEGG